MCPHDGWVAFRNSELICGRLGKVTLGGGSKASLFQVLTTDYSPAAAAEVMNRLARLSVFFPVLVMPCFALLHRAMPRCAVPFWEMPRCAVLRWRCGTLRRYWPRSIPLLLWARASPPAFAALCRRASIAPANASFSRPSALTLSNAQQAAV